MNVSKNMYKWFRIAPGLLDCAERAYSGTESLVCPSRDLVFTALEDLAPEEVRLVILGQDPYHTPGKACGRAFGYHENYQGLLNSSLINIVDEVYAGTPDSDMVRIYESFDINLLSWARQGVLLLNTCLTVEAHKPMSHHEIGWQDQIEKILKYLSEYTDTVFMAWGREARLLYERVGVPSDRVIATSHPCKYSNTRANADVPAFSGSGCFIRVNELLKKLNREEIRW